MALLAADLRDIEAWEERDAKRTLAGFVRRAWTTLEPQTPLVWSWHLDAICSELEAITRGEGNELVICVPPGHAKSLVVAVFWPAWSWLAAPGHRWLAVANDDAVAARDNRRMREIVRADWYQAMADGAARLRGDPPWRLAMDQDEKVNFETTARGLRQCGGIAARVTGKRADALIVDDPYDAKAALLGSPEEVRRRMRDVVTVYDEVLASRLNDATRGARVTIMQRLHEEDLAGVLIRRGVRSVVLPTEYEPDRPDRYDRDPRTHAGELLCPARFGPEALARIKGQARYYASQHQQRPGPAEGGLFQRAWFARRYPMRGCDAPVGAQWISVDCAFKGAQDSDYVCMQVWGAEGADYYLLDQLRARLDYPGTRAALLGVCRAWPRAAAKIIEDKANGSALIADLRAHVPGLIAYSPTESKYARAQVSAAYYEAGNVLLPAAAHWVEAYIHEHLGFPAASNDDQVDCSSQALIWYGQQGGWGVD